MPRRPCLVCGELADGSHCPAHRPRSGSRAWAGGTTGAWRTLRARALRRDGDQCVRCGATDRLEVHHLRSRADGGPDTLDNLETRCRACHCAAHTRPA